MNVKYQYNGINGVIYKEQVRPSLRELALLADIEKLKNALRVMGIDPESVLGGKNEQKPT